MKALNLCNDLNVSNFFQFLGDFGRYQAFQFVLHLLSALTAGVHMLSLVTVGAVPGHRCFLEGIDTNETTAPWNSSEVLAGIPMKNGEIDSCSMFGPNETIVACDSYVYDRTYYQSSRAMDWDFVCDKRWMIALGQTLYMMGTFSGAFYLGGLADKVKENLKKTLKTKLIIFVLFFLIFRWAEKRCFAGQPYCNWFLVLV